MSDLEQIFATIEAFSAIVEDQLKRQREIIADLTGRHRSTTHAAKILVDIEADQVQLAALRIELLSSAEAPRAAPIYAFRAAECDSAERADIGLPALKTLRRTRECLPFDQR